MPIASVIVEVEEGVAGAVLSGLAAVPGASVYGVKEHKIIVVIEGAALSDIDDCVRSLQSLDHVTGVYPVYATTDD